MRIEDNIKLDFDDVLIRPKRSTLKSRADVDLRRRFNFLHCSFQWRGVPLIASNMDTVGTLEASRVLKENQMITWFHKFIDYKEFVTSDFDPGDYVAPTIGENEPLPIEWGNGPMLLRIDVANGYRESFVDFVHKVREVLGGSCIIFAGNVVTPEQTEELLLNGADVVVIGIGSGGQCTTRIKAGVGYPQLSAIIECADAAHGLGGLICSDGGARNPGDVVKAFAAGADFVSLGSMLAGHEENTLEENLVYFDNKGRQTESDDWVSIKAKCYGMSSEEAMMKHYGEVAKHRTSEGRVSLIPWRGKLQNTIDDILGGLRSGCTYVGAKRLKELSKRTTFIKVNRLLNEHWT